MTDKQTDQGKGQRPIARDPRPSGLRRLFDFGGSALAFDMEISRYGRRRPLKVLRTAPSQQKRVAHPDRLMVRQGELPEPAGGGDERQNVYDAEAAHDYQHSPT